MSTASASETETLLQTISTALKAGDLASITQLESHQDKKVRKEARRAIHKLKSQGVEVPVQESRSWSAGEALQDLREQVGEAAILDVKGVPGASRFAWAWPGEQGSGRGRLAMILLGPDDRVLNCELYTQTDGQRAKLLREWDRALDEKFKLPTSWVRARINWARECSVRQGHAVPDALNALLPELLLEGETTPEARPTSCIVEELEAHAPSTLKRSELLMRIGLLQWPMLFDAEEMMKRLNQSTEGLPEEDGDRQKVVRQRIQEAGKGDEKLRTGLRGPIANALEDCAVQLWSEGDREHARGIYELYQELRTRPDPEMAEDVDLFIQLQVTGMAMRQGMNQNAANPTSA